MNDSFNSLPMVVAEGRRVVNNLQNATSMFFMKTVYVITINIMLIIMHFGLGQTMASPLTSLQVTLMDAVVVALPTFVLAILPNRNIIKGNFLTNVLKRCFPASLTFIVTTAIIYALRELQPDMIPTNEQLGTLVTITYTFGGICAVHHALKPLTKWKLLAYIFVWVIVLVALLVPQFYSTLSYVPLTREQLLLLIAEILATPFILNFFEFLFFGPKNCMGKSNKKKTN